MLNLNAIQATAVNAATGTAIQAFSSIVETKLCGQVCQNQSIQPTATVTYSLENQTQNGTTTFVDLVANGTVSYVPKGGSGCCVRQKAFTERTTLIFSNATATNPIPAIFLAQGVSAGSLADKTCTTAHAYQIATSVAVTATWS